MTYQTQAPPPAACRSSAPFAWPGREELVVQAGLVIEAKILECLISKIHIIKIPSMNVVSRIEKFAQNCRQNLISMFLKRYMCRDECKELESS